MQSVRPNGAGQIVGAWVTLCLGIIVSLVGIFWDVRTYPSVDLEALAMKWSAIYLGGGMITISFFLFLAGWIIRAIYFLPGREDVPTFKSEVAASEIALEYEAPNDNKWLYLTIGGLLVLFVAVAAYSEFTKEAAHYGSESVANGAIEKSMP